MKEGGKGFQWDTSKFGGKKSSAKLSNCDLYFVYILIRRNKGGVVSARNLIVAAHGKDTMKNRVFFSMPRAFFWKTEI